jgi:hypothetical protein
MARYLKRGSFDCGCAFAQDKLMTPNCARGMFILYLGENYVHPLDGVDKNLSIKSIKSILSTLVAPQLHQKPT